MEYVLAPSSDLDICINATTAAGKTDIREFDGVRKSDLGKIPPGIGEFDGF